MIGGISAWYILNKRHQEFFTQSFKIVLIGAIAIAPLQIYAGHLSGEVLGSLMGFIFIYSILFICALTFGSRIIAKGPNLDLPIPGQSIIGLKVEPAEHKPDSRPVEAQ